MNIQIINKQISSLENRMAELEKKMVKWETKLQEMMDFIVLRSNAHIHRDKASTSDGIVALAQQK